MFKTITANSITAVAAAALAAGLAVCLNVAPEAKAESQVTSALEQPLAKGDRLTPRVMGAACSSRSWPNYDPGCQFDLRRPADEIRSVRTIALR